MCALRLAFISILLLLPPASYAEEKKSEPQEVNMRLVAEQYEAAEKHRSVGEHQEALEIYQNLNAQGVAFPELHAKRSNALFRIGNKAEALEALELALQQQKDDPELWFNKGVLLYSMKDYAAALDAFTASIGFNPRDEVAWHNKGLALNRLDRHQEAADAYNTALDLKSPYFSASYNLFLSQVASGQFRLARKLIDKLVLEYPDRLQTHITRGQFLMAQGAWEEAETSFRIAVSFDPEIASLWRSIAICRAQTGDYVSAIDSYQKALVLKPTWQEVRAEKKEVEELLENEQRDQE